MGRGGLKKRKIRLSETEDKIEKNNNKLLYLQLCVILFYFFPQIVAISFNIM
jgi:hypothetical protein